MSWPTAAVLISLIACAGVVAVFALRELAHARGRSEADLEKRKELLVEVSAEIDQQMTALRKQQELSG